MNPAIHTRLSISTSCGGACTNGQSIDHQLAMFVPDTQAAGAFATIVSYSATTN